MRVEVTVKHSDLSSVRYEYWLNGFKLHLDKMIILERPSKRHGLQINRAESYSRVDQREYGIKEEPNVDIEIQQEAIRIARDMIKIERWKR